MTDESEPLEQLRLVHAELNRQRDSTADKHRTMHQRASLLIGASTVVTGVQAARIPEAWHRVASAASSDASTAVPLLAFVLAVAAVAVALWSALEGLRTLRVETGDEILIDRLAINVLSGPATVYAAEWSLVRDKIGVHLADMRRLEERRLLYTRGARLLVVSWILAIIQFIASAV